MIIINENYAFDYNDTCWTVYKSHTPKEGKEAGEHKWVAMWYYPSAYAMFDQLLVRGVEVTGIEEARDEIKAWGEKLAEIARKIDREVWDVKKV